MNQYPAKPMMDRMAQHGRYGDSMLVHMNPVEVAGIAAMSPTGRLTTNPVTGQPEAFLPLLFGGLGGLLKLSPLMTGALTGIGTAAVTGDLKRGLISGLTAGFGAELGGGISDLFGADTVADAATTVADVADTAVAGLDTGTAIADLSAVDPGLLDPAGIGADLAATQDAVAGLGQAPFVGAPDPTIASQLDQSIAAVDALPAPITTGVPDYVAQSPLEKLDTGVGNFMDKIGTQGQLVGGLMGQSVLEEMDMMDRLRDQRRQFEQDAYDDEMMAFNDLQAGYAAAQPNLGMGVSPYRSMMSSRLPGPYMPELGAASGGQMPAVGMFYGGTYNQLMEEFVRLQQLGQLPSGVTNFQQYLQYLSDQGSGDGDDGDDGDPEEPQNEFTEEFYPDLDPDTFDDTGETKRALNEARRGGPLGRYRQGLLERYYNRREQLRQQYLSDTGQDQAEDSRLAEAARSSGRFGYVGDFGAIDPVAVQAGLRGDYKISAPLDYMAGFEPEFQYFQDNRDAPFIPTRAFRPTREGITSEGVYFDPIIDRENYLSNIREYYRTLASYGMGGGPSDGGDDAGGGDDGDDGGTDNNGGNNGDNNNNDDDNNDPGPDPTGGDNGGDDGGDDDSNTGDNNGDDTVADPDPTGGNNGGNNGGSDGGNNNNGGGIPPGYGEGFRKPARLKEDDPFIHSRRGEMWGHAVGEREEMDLDYFLENILPKAGGKYGLGMHYDEERGKLWSNIDEETMLRYRGTLPSSGQPPTNFTGLDGVNPDYLTDLDVVNRYAQGHGDNNAGADHVRIGDGYTGSHYYIVGDKVYKYDYKETNTNMPTFPLDQSTELSEPVYGDPYANDLSMEGVVSAVNGQPVQKVPGEGNLPGDIPPNWDELYAEEQSADAGLPEDPPETEPVPEDPGDDPVTDPGGDPDGGEPDGLDMDTAIAEKREDKPDTGGAQAVSQPPPPMMSQPAPSMDLPPPPPEIPDLSGLGIDMSGIPTMAPGVTQPPSTPQQPPLAPEAPPMMGGTPDMSGLGGMFSGFDPAAIAAAQAEEEERKRREEAQMMAAQQAMASGMPGAFSSPAMTVPPRGRGGRRGERRMMEGGTTMLQSSLGPLNTPSGGIADVETAFTAIPSGNEVNALADALLKGAKNADTIIQAFLDKYGTATFSRVRDKILEMVVPNSQKEGMIRGNGGGMDDKISGMIGSSQPVAVSPGEFIVPADVVSDLGDGSSDAGADELYAMMERVRKARGGNGDQPPAISARRNMPA